MARLRMSRRRRFGHSSPMPHSECHHSHPVAAEAHRPAKRPSETPAAGPCASCRARTDCIRFGWLSPAGVWFDRVIVIEPPAGCRGHEQSRDDIARRFGRG